jgi:hypothetical protein
LILSTCWPSLVWGIHCHRRAPHHPARSIIELISSTFTCVLKQIQCNESRRAHLKPSSHSASVASGKDNDVKLIALAVHKFNFLSFYVRHGWKDLWQIDDHIIVRRMTSGEDDDQGEIKRFINIVIICHTYLDFSLLDSVHTPNIDSGRSTLRCFKIKWTLFWSLNPVFG